MNEEVTLTVFKNSPHIWAGGLEGEDLAKWLMGRANAIMFAEAQKLKLSEVKGLLIDLNVSGMLTQSLGYLRARRIPFIL